MKARTEWCQQGMRDSRKITWHSGVKLKGSVSIGSERSGWGHLETPVKTTRVNQGWAQLCLEMGCALLWLKAGRLWRKQWIAVCRSSRLKLKCLWWGSLDGETTWWSAQNPGHTGSSLVNSFQYWQALGKQLVWSHSRNVWATRWTPSRGGVFRIGGTPGGRGNKKKQCLLWVSRAGLSSSAESIESDSGIQSIPTMSEHASSRVTWSKLIWSLSGALNFKAVYPTAPTFQRSSIPTVCTVFAGLSFWLIGVQSGLTSHLELTRTTTFLFPQEDRHLRKG